MTPLTYKNEILKYLDSLNNFTALECGHIAHGFSPDDCKEENEKLQASKTATLCPICWDGKKAIVTYYPRRDKGKKNETPGQELKVKIRECYEKALLIDNPINEKKCVKKFQRIIQKILESHYNIDGIVTGTFKKILQIGRDEKTDDAMEVDTQDPELLAALAVSLGNDAFSISKSYEPDINKLEIHSLSRSSDLEYLSITKDKSGTTIKLRFKPNGSIVKKLEEIEYYVPPNATGCGSIHEGDIVAIWSILQKEKLFSNEKVAEIAAFFKDPIRIPLTDIFAWPASKFDSTILWSKTTPSRLLNNHSCAGQRPPWQK